MSVWKTFVVEDEKITQDHICAIVSEDDELELVGTSSGVSQALEQLLELDPALLLLDIQIADGNSFEILEALNHSPEIIFITAYNRFAIRAFEESAVDYVLKPFDKKRLQQALSKAKDRLRNKETSQKLTDLRELMGKLLKERTSGAGAFQVPIKVQGKTLLRKANEIEWIEASKNQAVLHIGQESFPIRETLISLEDRFSGLNFARIHRSTIVNLDFVEEVQSWFHGDYVIILRDGTRLKMSRRYKRNFEERISGHL